MYYIVIRNGEEVKTLGSHNAALKFVKTEKKKNQQNWYDIVPVRYPCAKTIY